MQRPPEDPFAPMLRGIIGLIVVIVLVLYLVACTTPPEATAKPAFPDDMRLVCYDGAYYLGSPSADEVVRLPIKCVEA